MELVGKMLCDGNLEYSSIRAAIPANDPKGWCAWRRLQRGGGRIVEPTDPQINRHGVRLLPVEASQHLVDRFVAPSDFRHRLLEFRQEE